MEAHVEPVGIDRAVVDERAQRDEKTPRVLHRAVDAAGVCDREPSRQLHLAAIDVGRIKPVRDRVHDLGGVQPSEPLCPRPGHRHQRVGRRQGLAFKPKIEVPTDRAISIVVVLRPQVTQIGDPGKAVPRLELTGDDMGSHGRRAADDGFDVFAPQQVLDYRKRNWAPVLIRVRVVHDLGGHPEEPVEQRPLRVEREPVRELDAQAVVRVGSESRLQDS